MRWPDCKILLRTLQLFVSYKHRLRAQPFTGTRGARDPALTIFRPASNDNKRRPECLSCSVSYTHRLLNNNTVYNINNNNNNITIISLYSTLTKNIQAIRCIILIFIYQIYRYLSDAYSLLDVWTKCVENVHCAYIFRTRSSSSQFIHLEFSMCNIIYAVYKNSGVRIRFNQRVIRLGDGIHFNRVDTIGTPTDNGFRSISICRTVVERLLLLLLLLFLARWIHITTTTAGAVAHAHDQIHEKPVANQRLLHITIFFASSSSSICAHVFCGI